MKKSHASSIALRFCLSALLFCLFCFQDLQAKPKKTDKAPKTRKTSVQQQTPPPVQKGVERPFKKAYAEIVSNVRKSEKLNTSDKKILMECFSLMAQTPRGKWLICHAPSQMIFEKFNDYFNGIYGGGKLGINERFFNSVSSSQTAAERQKSVYQMISILSHEMTHACQHNFSVYEMHGASTTDETIMFKLCELQGELEAATVRGQLLDLPYFRVLRENEPRLTSFVREVTERKQKESVSYETAERFARTEFVKAYWRNSPNQPTKIGNDVFVAQNAKGWNVSYDDDCFKGDMKPYKAEGASIDDVLCKAVSFMQVDIEPEFFKREKAFQYEHGRLVGYLNGIKDHELDFLTVGRIRKIYEDSRLRLVFLLNSKRLQNGSFKDYWDGTKRIRATYTIKNKQATGAYREYDYAGNQVAEIPFKDGRADGMGWFVEQGKKVPKRFHNGICYDIHEQDNNCYEEQIREARERYQKILKRQKVTNAE